jgi:hypothetical protein
MIDLSCLITSFVTVLDAGDQRVAGPGGGNFNAHRPIARHVLPVWLALDCPRDLFLC